MAKDDSSRGLIVDSNCQNSTIKLNSDGQIEYPNGHSLTWYKSGAGFVFDYHTNSRASSLKKVRLNTLLDYGEWVFVPVESGFSTRVREHGVVKAYPEIQLSVPVLRKSELEILSALHEVGHADFYNQVHSSVQRGQLLNLDGTYGEQLVGINRLLTQILGVEYEEVSEILAWKKALLYDLRFSILPHFTEAEKATLIRNYLGTYLGVTKAIWTV